MYKPFILIVGIIISVVFYTNKNSQNISKQNEIIEIIENNKDSIKLKEIQNIVQEAINLPILQHFFHKKQLIKIPLNLLKNKYISSSLKINKFGEKLKIVNTINESTLIFSNIRINKKSAYVDFNYKKEGIKCNISLYKEENKWIIKESKLIEN